MLILAVITFLLSTSNVEAQIQQYREAPAEMKPLLEAPPFPRLYTSPNRRFLALGHWSSLDSLEQLSSQEKRLAGLRFNPENRTKSRIRYKFDKIEIKLANGTTVKTLRFSQGPVIYPKWSPDGQKLAFLQMGITRLNLFYAAAPKFRPQRISSKPLNCLIGNDCFHWSSDSSGIYYLHGNIQQHHVPDLTISPIIQETSDKKTAVRTYQDLLKNAADEDEFKYFFSSQLSYTDFAGKQRHIINSPQLIADFSLSPTGKHILITALHPPFSYLVPYYRFSRSHKVIHSSSGAITRQLVKLPVTDSIPQGFSATYQGPRHLQWIPFSDDKLSWVEALDGGDPSQDFEFRDQIWTMGLHEKATPIAQLKYRFSDIVWLSANKAITKETWWANRWEISRVIDFSAKSSPKVLFDRSYEDTYSDPGEPVQVPFSGAKIGYLSPSGKVLYAGLGASPDGYRPFVQEVDISSAATKKIWQSSAPNFSRVIEYLDAQKNSFLMIQESSQNPPNLYSLRILPSQKSRVLALTKFAHPYPTFKKVKRIDLRYQRADGIELSAILYLPPSEARPQSGKWPVVLWAYPREYKTKEAAGQIRQSKYQFKRISYKGAMPFLARGIAVLDKVSMPIVGIGTEEPNDSFIKQLSDNAKAALKALSETEKIDTNRAAIAGHSYGAFMVANLLAHTDLFRAGIARSGAYNRTFTPFGFQAEERTYWQIPGVYNAMSPFQNANMINEPILIIHGERDNNSGTFPLQSKRLFHAISGLGGTARLVILPLESHGYRAKESWQHLLWEQDQWLRRYLFHNEQKKQAN